MEEHPRSFDVCIVCALPEEARAFLEVVRPQCEGTIEERLSPRYHYSYRFASLMNERGKLLKLHISWLPRYGPEEMTLHLSRVLEEYQPRIAIMTGICAGDARHVQLGDLVVAERTFTYDNGKFALDDGRRVHLHDTLTYQLDANTLQFLGLFDMWKPLVARLKRPPSPLLEHGKRRKIACHIKPMASGSAVRADHPFEDVQAPVRGTVAIDMEGAAFGLVMSRHPLIRWLVIKGVCDYADQDKNDVYHNYAARASALYALSFIRAYVTDERLPSADGPSPSGQAAPSGVWNVPYARNQHFTGRDELLDRLNEHFKSAGQYESSTTRRAALTQPQAIRGLGGIGKTQIAVEYAYRSREHGLYKHTLWVNAASEETIMAGFVAIAEVLPTFTAKHETDQYKLVEAIKRWLEQCEQRWLLIFDNVDSTDSLPIVEKYLPQSGNGNVLLTTRAHAIGSLAVSMTVEKMGIMEGTQFLLRRAQREDHASDEEINEAINVVIALDHFPLALDQAGAYIEETGCSFGNYLQLYQDYRKTLHSRRGFQITNYPDSVATTWSLSFQKVEQANPAAAELLCLCAFLAPDNIPEELIRDGSIYWSPLLQHAAADLYSFNRMMEELLKFSLVQRLVETQIFSIHRLVQAVQLDRMEPEVQRQWAERVIRAMNKVFPRDTGDISTWPQCSRYLDQAQVCDFLIGRYGLQLTEAADILDRVGDYLYRHALYGVAESLYKRALSIYEQELGSEHSSTALVIHNLARLYYKQSRYTEAEPLYQRSLIIYEREFGLEHLSTATNFHDLADLYRMQARYEEAESLYQRTLAIKERLLGSNHSEVSTSLNALAGFYVDQGKYEQAESLYQRALAIKERQLGPEHPHIATGLNNLANLYRDKGKYEQAEPLYQRALAIDEQQLGPQHPDTASIIHNLARHYRIQGKYEQAEPLYQRALVIYERMLGLEHPDVATALNSLANCYSDQGKDDQAEPLYQRALAIEERQLGSEHPDVATTLNNLAYLYMSQGRYEQAEPLYRRALVIYERHLGPEHPVVASIIHNLASLYSRQNKYAEAEPLYKRVLHIREHRLGPEHPDVAAPLNNLANLYRNQGKDDQAEPLYRRALAIEEQQLGLEHDDVVKTLNNLAMLYYKQGRYTEVEPLYQRVLQIQEHRLGPEHVDVAASLNNLAILYHKQGKYTEAKPLYQRALRIQEQQLGPEHSSTQATKRNYAFLPTDNGVR